MRSFCSCGFCGSCQLMRMEALHAVFMELDADGKQQLDIHEITMFLRYSFETLFSVTLKKAHVEVSREIKDNSRRLSIIKS